MMIGKGTHYLKKVVHEKNGLEEAMKEFRVGKAQHSSWAPHFLSVRIRLPYSALFSRLIFEVFADLDQNTKIMFSN